MIKGKGEEQASNFEALHVKISGTEERLNDITEQTEKKFQIVKENVKEKKITITF